MADGVEECPGADNLNSCREVHALLQLSQDGLELSTELVQHLTKLGKTHRYHGYIRCDALEEDGGRAGGRGRGDTLSR